MYQANSYHPEDSPTYISPKAKPKDAKKARFFANMAALLWFYYCIGNWYGSKFVETHPMIEPGPAVFFGATFAVWFFAFFLHIGFTLVKQHRPG